MNKIQVNGYFKNNQFDEAIEYNTFGTIENNIMNFSSKNDNLIISINDSNIIFTKENENSKLVYNLILNEITSNNIYCLKNNGEKFQLELSVKTTKISRTNNSLIVNFEMDTEDNNKIKYELNIKYRVM